MSTTTFAGTLPLKWLFMNGLARPVRKVLSLTLMVFEFLTRLLRTANSDLTHFLYRHYFSQNLTDAEVGGLEVLEKYFSRISVRVRKLPLQPKFSIIVPIYKVDLGYFAETLRTIELQVYDNWELCAVDDASGDPRIIDALKKFAAKHHGKVHWAQNEVNSHISITSNRCLEMASGDYVVLLDHDDRLLPNALAEMVRFINWMDEPDILYSDERVIDEHGNHPVVPFYKPSWSPFLHMSVNYTTHLSVYRRSLVESVGGFRKGYEGSQDHDLMLRLTEVTKKPVVHVPFTLYQWRASENSTARSLDNKSYAADAGVRAVKDACERRGRPADVIWEPQTVHYRVKFHLPTPLPKISIVVPTKDNAKFIKSCVTSVFELSTYENFELCIVDNGSKDRETLETFTDLLANYGPRLKVIPHPIPFNYAELNNFGVRHTDGEYVVLLNDDTQVIAPEWLEELLRYAQFPEVGAVGGKLLYESERIQHAGMVLLDRAIAGHSYKHYEDNNDYYMNFCHTVHEAAGVTAACLMISRKKYEEVAGLDEVFVPNGFGDVDFCLRLRERGYQHVYTPYAKLYHFESVTRGAEIENFERFYMVKRWGLELMNDPFLNFNYARTESFHWDGAVGAIDPTASMFRGLLGGAPAKIRSPL